MLFRLVVDDEEEEAAARAKAAERRILTLNLRSVLTLNQWFILSPCLTRSTCVVFRLVVGLTLRLISLNQY